MRLIRINSVNGPIYLNIDSIAWFRRSTVKAGFTIITLKGAGNEVDDNTLSVVETPEELIRMMRHECLRLETALLTTPVATDSNNADEA